MLARMKWLKRALGKDYAEKQVTAGVVHAREGRLSDAIACYQNAIEADETFAVAHLDAGLARLDAFNAQAAALDDEAVQLALVSITQQLELALRLDDTSLVGWRALAHVQARRHNFHDAHEAWKRVRERAAADTPSAAEADRALKDLADKAVVDRCRKRAISAATDTDVDAQRTALDELVVLLARLPVERGWAIAGALARRTDDPRAHAFLSKAIESDAHDVDAVRDLAGVCLSARDFSAALRWSMAAYRARPTDAALVCNVGVCHLGLDDLTRAEEFIELAQRLEPKDPIVLRAVAALKARKRDAAHA